MHEEVKGFELAMAKRKMSSTGPCTL